MLKSSALGQHNPTNKPEFESGILTLLVGPTASGKTTVLEGLLHEFPDMRRVVTTTTRPRREKEVNGKDYHFLHPLVFNVKVRLRGFLETGKYGGNLYGTQKRDVVPVLHGHDLAWIITMAGATELENNYNRSFRPRIAQAMLDRTLLVLIGTPTLFDLRKRFRSRKSSDNFLPRLREDWGVWQRHRDKFPYVVVNHEGQIGRTINEVSDLINDRRTRLKHMLDS